ncbi:MAG: DUF305 domain-containing protein [Thermomicrobiales bacterium]
MVSITRRALLASAGSIAGALILAACGSTRSYGGKHGATGAYDQNFIDAMVPHHQAAIDMAKVAQRKAEHAELRQLADAIVGAQDSEIAQMKAWRTTWYGSGEIAPGMGSHQMGGMDTDPAHLEDAAPFDKAFIDAMIPHHQSAIDMAQEAMTQAQHREIKNLAARIVAAQQAEITRMNNWRAAWYPGA